jgi:hypothetical protein
MTQRFFCRGGYDPGECQQRIAALKAVLIEYPVGSLKHWSWVIVRSEDWQPLRQSLRLEHDSPAFTALAEREIFLEDALFIPQPKRTDQLVRSLQTPFARLLAAAVTHELGHAICHGSSEATANHVAEQLRRGKTPDCSGTTLNPIDELYLHRQSAGLPGSGRH